MARALPVAAGNAATAEAVRRLARLTDAPSAKWSNRNKFATQKNPANRLGAQDGDLPGLPGAVWHRDGDLIYDGLGTVKPNLPRWLLRWAGTGTVVKVPKDCITTAELVAAWLKTYDPATIGIIAVKPKIDVATAGTTLGPGDILFHVHDDAEGNFHGAAVIAEDDGDVVTMESDASAGDAIAESSPLFDMYAGHAGFRKSQGDNPGEKTYVIHFLEGREPINEDTKSLWAEIGDATYTVAGRRAAEAIKQAIDAAIKARTSATTEKT